jgi:mRNA-degrading endonuclease RelE of RelBE toxin-antitoxin system
MKRRVAQALARLETDPRRAGVKRLSGRPHLRVRVGDQRIIFAIADRQKAVLVERILSRNERTYE